MLRFNGTYTLSRKDDPGASRSAFACSWNVKIIDFSSADPAHLHIRPWGVLAVRQAGGIFKSSCAESLGKRIINDFALKVDDLLWVESFPDAPHQLYVAAFTPRYEAAQVHYAITWRPILENERNALRLWCPETRNRTDS
ncbi:hypothetical protein DESC_610210 [Desulfosarcina cetonica]|uniref:hypothetical protein n=1 Tax=Desulfosarcina cetonica TaxID=90730 RepID=UPI0012ECE333|nr:hypothetical protein [Desulfosarcina cetonica]VTR67627.1 hypothetical protein DESC_610210 [Desulfosarcina cetonica]